MAAFKRPAGNRRSVPMGAAFRPRFSGDPAGDFRGAGKPGFRRRPRRRFRGRGPGTGQMPAIHPGPAGPAGGPRPHRAHRRADPGPSRPGISAAAGGRKFPGIAGNRPPGDAAYAGRGPAAGKRGFPVRMPCDGSMGPHPHAAPGTAGRSGIHPALRPPMILRFWYILRPVRMNKARYFP